MESKARRAAKKVGLIATKSRRSQSIDNQGGFMLLDASANVVVNGERYNLSPEEVIEFCTQEEGK